MRFHIAVVMIIMSITAGDLIGWNRTRNTAHKHMFVRNKVDTTALLYQYRNFQKIQKLSSLVVKNIEKRAADKNAGAEQQQEKQKRGRFNRRATFRKFHS